MESRDDVKKIRIGAMEQLGAIPKVLKELQELVPLLSVAYSTDGRTFGYEAPCILVLVVHNAAVAGATDRLLLGPCSSLETARKHESSRPPFGVARTVAGAAALLRSKPVSARPGPHQKKGEAKQ